MTSGWIKLHRKIFDNPIVCKDSEHFIVWCYLLANASHKEHPFLFGKDKVILKAGQLITSTISISKKFGINRKKIERILKVFENDQQIVQRVERYGRVITIIAWDKYQILSNNLSNECPTCVQPVSINKNVKNDNNINNKRVNNNINNNINNARTRYVSKNTNKNKVINNDKSEDTNDEKSYPQVQNGVKSHEFYKKVNARLLGKTTLPTQAQINLINGIVGKLENSKDFVKIVDYVTLAFKYPSYKNLGIIASEIEQEYNLTSSGVNAFLEAKNKPKNNTKQSVKNTQNFKQDTYRNMTKEDAMKIMRKNNPALRVPKEEIDFLKNKNISKIKTDNQD